MNITRRTVAASAAFVTPAFLAACAQNGTPVPTQLTNALTVGQSIDQALIKILADISTPPIGVLTPTQAAPITADLQLAATALSAFLAGGAPPAGASTLDQVNAYFMTAMNAAAPVLAVVLPAATPIILAIEAVDALLPIFEAAIPQATTVAAARVSAGRVAVHRAAMARGAMSPDKALGVIQGYLGRK